jgi:hypothetical protein
VGFRHPVSGHLNLDAPLTKLVQLQSTHPPLCPISDAWLNSSAYLAPSSLRDFSRSPTRSAPASWEADLRVCPLGNSLEVIRESLTVKNYSCLDSFPRCTAGTTIRSKIPMGEVRPRLEMVSSFVLEQQTHTGAIPTSYTYLFPTCSRNLASYQSTV